MVNYEEKHAFADIHCHLLYGVDDGAKNREEALKMLEIAAEEGITDMMLTPHAKGDRLVPPRMLQERLQDIRELAREHGIPIRFSLGNEIYYLNEVEERLRNRRLLTLSGDGHVLVEFGPDADYIYIRNALLRLKMAGYRPIIAHVERYIKLINVERVEFLRENGAEIQVNAASVSGEAGFGIKQYVKKLLKRGLVDYVGTDAHSAGIRAPRVRKCLKYLYAKYDAEYVDSIVYNNTKSLMDSKE